MKKKRSRKTKSGPPLARLPLPKKGEKRHDDAKKYDRPKEKERLRKEIGPPGYRQADTINYPWAPSGA